jgi:RNA-binding protein
MSLSGNQRRYLRSLGHHLTPIVQVGKEGPTEGVIAALNQALLDHELVKVKLGQSVTERPEVAEALAQGTASECAQILGRTVLFYKRHPKKPKIQLPAPRSAPPGAAEVAEEDEDASDEDVE